MNKEQLKILLEGVKEPIIDFCNLELTRSNYFAFEAFAKEEVIEVLKEANSGKIWLLDYAYSLGPLNENEGEIALAIDHLNLSTLNPTLGPVEEGPRFYTVNNLYEKPATEPKLPEVVLVGVNPGTKPTVAESDILMKSGPKCFNYNSVRAALAAALTGLKVVSLVMLKAS